MEEHNYYYDDVAKTIEKSGIVTATYDKGKLVSYKNQYLGDYPSESEMVYTYDSKGLLEKKIYKDISYDTQSVYTYQYEKGKLMTELYESEYSNTVTKYEYDKKGRVIKATTTDEEGNITSISEYSDYGANEESYTLTYKYMVDGVASSTGVSKYVNSKTGCL
jgi:YD repeat-containing protein